ncbi:MAG TPA: glycoside hydrolase family 2 TIM barrel-domain containing protein [Bryobacteraceae bacterium]|nr:glycoside hydrolase family 2 TIM barrel-domain containing protein [Bryobacteraceae bacterium]
MRPVAALLLLTCVHAAAATVRIVQRGDSYSLERDGKPYFIRGAVANMRFDLLAAVGGNSVRSGPRDLDRAQASGLTVLVNLPLGLPRRGFNYADRQQVEQQRSRIREMVTQHKDHPAVLMWALGNELSIHTTREQRIPMWKELNQLARMIHQNDGKHPVLTPFGDAYRHIINELDEFCPDLDAVGLNAYTDMLTLPEDLAKKGWKRPYVVTEFGPRGHWQVEKTQWKVPIEDSTTEKAQFYIRAYQHAVAKRPQSLGSYTFYWSQKMEKTHTWYGMFLPDGSRTAPIDAMQFLWTGKWPANRAPAIGPLKITVNMADSRVGGAKPWAYTPGSRLLCNLDVFDPDGDALRYGWEVRPDVADDPRVGGDFEQSVAPIAGAVKWIRLRQAEIELPRKPGKYRIFAYAWDGKGSAATVNLPVIVENSQPTAYPTVPGPAEVSRLGTRLQRTMRLLAESTPEHRNQVRILFYGQSITKQDWSRQVAEDLRRRFPAADLVIENRSIGGYSSPYLVRTLPQDVYPFYPDLVIFHVYGAEKEYEEIIRGIRENTTAEIAIQTDHETGTNTEARTKRSQTFLPSIAEKYGCELIDIHRPWMEYLKASGLEPKQLLRDGVHLNAHGNFVMAELTKPYLRLNEESPVRGSGVREFRVGGEVEWLEGRLVVEFDGNRVDLVSGAGLPSVRARVLIDGKPPSQIPELYVHSRPSEAWGADWTSINRVSSIKPLLVEDWRVELFDVAPDAAMFRFRVIGSRTGPDGNGLSTERFVSNSGRVVIEPGDWAIKRAYDLRKKPMPEGFVIHWSVLPLFQDLYEAPDRSDLTREHSVILAQGLSNGKHRLELVAEGATAPSVSAVRVYRPALP